MSGHGVAGLKDVNRDLRPGKRRFCGAELILIEVNVGILNMRIFNMRIYCRWVRAGVSDGNGRRLSENGRRMF